MSELFIGLMSGTSMDGIDAVLADFSVNPPSILAHKTTPYPDALRHDLSKLGNSEHRGAEKQAELDEQLGRLFVDAVLELLDDADVAAKDIVAIGSHGQTIWHEPDGPTPYSLQIGNAKIIAKCTGIKTVADFRNNDIKAGGQGAPLVPPFHHAVFHTTAENRVALNIGGIANITVLPKSPAQDVTGFDTGPGNGLMNSWTERNLKQAFDENGQWAASGKVHTVLLNSLLTDPYFQKAPPKSTGREYFNIEWLDRHLSNLPAQSPEDIQATLCELTAASIANAISRYAPDTGKVLVCGGGVHNNTLMQRLSSLMNQAVVESTEAHGINPDLVEATAFAWIAQQTINDKPGNLPSVTGARKAVVLGKIYNK